MADEDDQKVEKYVPKMGRPPIEFTPQILMTIEALISVGAPLAMVAQEIGISERSIQRHCKEQLEEGHARANARVGFALFENAMQGNTPAQMFWLKARAGWKEAGDKDKEVPVEPMVIAPPEPLK